MDFILRTFLAVWGWVVNARHKIFSVNIMTVIHKCKQKFRSNEFRSFEKGATKYYKIGRTDRAFDVCK